MLSYLFIYFCWLSGLFLIGHLVSSILAKAPNIDFYSTALRNILTGYAVVIVVYSVFITRFQTINLVLLFVLALMFFELRKKIKSQPEGNYQFKIQYLITVLLAAAVLFSFNWYGISNDGSYLGFFYNQGDYILYSRIADSLSRHGHENGFTVLNILDPYYSNPEPYHFFDIWGAATVSRIFGTNTYVALILIVYPTFYLLCFLGYVAVIRKYNLAGYAFAFLLLFIGGITINLLDSYPFFRSLSNLSHNLLSPSIYKLSYFYVFLISSYLLFRASHIALAVLVCFCLPLANIITFPTLVPAIFISLLAGYFSSEFGRKEIIRSLVYLAITSSLVVLFYFVNQRQSAGLAGAEISKPLQLLKGTFTLDGLITQRNILIGGVLALIVLYSPSLVLVAINYKFFRSRKFLGIFLFTIISISLCVYAILFQELNSSQIFSNISIPLANVSSAIILAGIYRKYTKAAPSRLLIILTGTVFLAFVGFNISRNVASIKGNRFVSHDDDYLKRIDQIIKPSSTVASIKAPAQMMEMHVKYNVVSPLGYYLLLLNKGCFAVSINDLSTPIDSTSNMNLARSMKAIRDGLFYRYSNLPANKNLDEPQLMKKFVREFNIKYLIVSKEAVLPSIFSTDIKTNISDPISGERFIELK